MALSDGEINDAYYFYGFAFTLYGKPQYLGKQNVLEKKAALLAYLNGAYFMDEQDLEAYAEEVRKGAAAAPQARFMCEGIKPYLKTNMLNLLPLLAYVDTDTKQEAIAGLYGLVDGLTFEIADTDTINVSGTIRVNYGDLLSKPGPALKFDLVHEFGHSAAAYLKHPSHKQKYEIVVRALSPRHDPYDVSSGNSAREMEYFADAFATVFLKGAGEHGDRIIRYASDSFGETAQSATHPSGADRVAYVTTLTTRLGLPFAPLIFERPRPPGRARAQ